MLINRSEGPGQSARLQQKCLTKGPADFLVADSQPDQTEHLVVGPSTTPGFKLLSTSRNQLKRPRDMFVFVRLVL